MRLFKYLEPRWAERMVNDGAIRIGTLYDFRRIEAFGAERGDADEGMRLATTGGKAVRFTGATGPAILKEVANIGPYGEQIVEEGAVLRIEIGMPDAFIFCSCGRFDAAVSGSFGGACVEIMDSHQFFSRVSAALWQWNRDGVRTATAFRLAACEYLEREETIPKTTPYDAVFRKPPRYSHQAEVRATWRPFAAEIAPLNLFIPEIRPFCKRTR